MVSADVAIMCDHTKVDRRPGTGFDWIAGSCQVNCYKTGWDCWEAG